MMDRYLEDIVNTDRHDRAFYATARLTEYFDGRAVDTITSADVARYRRRRSEQNVKDSTINKELRTLSAAANHARVEWGWPIKQLTIRLPRQPGRIRWITPAEARTLIKAAKTGNQGKAGYLSNMIVLALNTGLRHRELLNLTWSRVDFKQKLIYLGAADQKGRRNSSVPLNRAAVRALKRQLGEHANWVFVCRGERIRSVRKSFATACRNAGIEDFTVHDLRHTAAAWLVQEGTPIRTVAEIMRHRDIATTMNYAHLAPENARQAVDAINFG